MSIIPKMSPPESLGEAIAPIAVLSDGEFKKLSDATSTRRSFSLRPKVVKELTLEISALGTNLPFTLGAPPTRLADQHQRQQRIRRGGAHLPPQPVGRPTRQVKRDDPGHHTHPLQNPRFPRRGIGSTQAANGRDRRPALEAASTAASTRAIALPTPSAARPCS
jgi:hypothetical protein